MNAITIEKPGESGELREVPDQQPAPGELRVRVTTAGVNPVDWKIRDGMTGAPPHLPLTLGQDFAGVVEALGANASGFKAGDRIFGVARTHGSYAEYTSVPPASQAEPVGVIPDGVTDAQAAALPTPALTALASLERLKVGAGSTVLIHGAAGAVGAFAVQLAHQRGARVLATVKGAPADVQSLGADDVFDGGDPVAAVKAKYPDGIDAVLDLVSSKKDDAMRFADVLHPHGAIVSTNHVLDDQALNERGFAATNIVMNETPQSSRQSLEYLAGLVASGRLIVRIGRTAPLAEAPRVLDRSKSGEMLGKTVLRVAESDDADQ